MKLVLNDPKGREKPCLRCGQSLRSHLDDRFCPRCGLSVWLSLNANDGLDASNPRWLRRCAIACCVMALAQFLGLLALPLLHVPQAWKPRAYAIAACIAGAYFLVYHTGLWLLAGYEGRHPDKTRIHRLAQRVVAGVALAVGLLLLGLGVARLNSGWPVPKSPLEMQREWMLRYSASQPATDEMEEDLADEVALTAGYFGLNGYVLLAEGMLIASILSTFAYVRRLAQRLPHPLIARLSGYLMFLPLISLFKVFPLFAALLAFYLHQLTVYFPWLYLPGSAVLLGMFAFQLLWASRRAAQNWAKETRPQSS